MEKLLSLSVASYNVEKLVPKTLDTIIESGVIDSVEVLVVNDGSKDSTAEVVSRYCERYPDSIKLINQENAGPGSTVNRGMDNATGKYFRMLDGDDWVDPKGFANFVKALETFDVDMVISDFVSVDDQTGEEQCDPLYKQGLAANSVTLIDEMCRALPTVSMHNVSYRTKLLQSNSVRVFNCFYTDMQYLLFPLPFVKTAVYIPERVYMYRTSFTGQSMSPASLQRNVAMHDKVLFSLVELYESYSKSESCLPAVADYIRGRVNIMAGAHMGILLSFKPCNERKADLYAYFDRLRNASPDIFAEFKKFKTCKVLKFKALYKAVSKMHRKKVGAD